MNTVTKVAGDISRDQIKCAQTLFSKLKTKISKDDKELIVSTMSNGRTTSVGQLRHSEAIELIKFLKSQDKDEVSADKQRKYIIAMAHEMRWEKNGKADMPRIDGWCKAFGYLHKGLNSYTQQELPTLVTQMEEVLGSYRDGLFK